MFKFIGYSIATVISAITLMFFVFPSLIFIGSALFFAVFSLTFFKWIAGFWVGVVLYHVGKKAFSLLGSEKSTARAVQSPDFVHRKVNAKEVEFMFSKEM